MKEKTATRALRWTGRTVGVLPCGFFAVFAVAEIVNGLQTGEFDPEGIAPVSLILLAALGVLLAFRWERFGGAMTVIGGLGMGLLSILVGGLGNLGVAMIFVAPTAVAGTLAFVCGTRERAM